jgi:type II secretory pathway pseudopilin PulG
MKMIKKNKQGFTLIELLLYFAIASGILMVTSLFLSVLLQSRIKGQVIMEVEQQGWQVMEQINQTIRNSTAVNTPAIGATSNFLNLSVTTPAKSPTVFNQTGNALQIVEGASLGVKLTNDRVVISNLQFNNLARTGTNGLVRVQFTITHLNPNNRYEYNYSQTFYGSAARR